MSRTMTQLAPTAHADNTLVDLATVPAGHKYEVLETWLELIGSGTPTVAVYSHTPAGYLFADVVLALPALTYLWRASFNALVLNAGDKLAAAAYGVGGSWSFYATYVDVDFS